MSEENLRLSKLLSQRGICSRRKADEWIEKGYIKVDGEVIRTLGVRVAPDCEIELSVKAKNEQAQQFTFILNKPLRYVSGTPEDNHPTAMKLLSSDNRDPQFKSNYEPPVNLKGLAPAGRLDINSTGLIIYTQNGVLAKKLIQQNSEVEKEYLVRVRGRLPDKNLKLLNHGLELDGKELKPAKVKWINDDQLQFVLVEGKKRQIRRMCELVDLDVLALKRVRIGPIKLGRLQEGMWRAISKTEMSEL
ncbi:MAG: rRNA pseudouridine synthase [Bdellovibrionaceae bacterium]|jgi:23S rRNA pseudouridine2604 synthase|nr:rRNA pseudouridine synthase [Pseudobdellovibrionaceae bacterium]